MTEEHLAWRRERGRDLAMDGLLHAAGEGDDESFVARVLAATSGTRRATGPAAAWSAASAESERRRHLAHADRPRRASRSSRRERVQNHRGPGARRSPWPMAITALGVLVIGTAMLLTAISTGVRTGSDTDAPIDRPMAADSASAFAAVLIACSEAVEAVRDGTSVALAVGSGVHPGEVVRVPAAGSASLRYADGTELDLVAGTRIGLDHGVDGGKRLVLHAGGVYARVAPQRRDLQVTSPQVVLDVVGTRFGFEVVDGISTIAVDEGLVRLSNGFGTLLLGAGEQAVVTDDSAPDALSPEGAEVVLRDDFVRDAGRWQHNEGAFPVRIESGMLVVDCTVPSSRGYDDRGWAPGASGVRSRIAFAAPHRITARISAEGAGDRDGLLAAIVLEPDRPDPGGIMFLVRNREQVQLWRQAISAERSEAPVLIESVAWACAWPEWEEIVLEVDASSLRVLVDGETAMERVPPEAFEPAVGYFVHFLGNAHRDAPDGSVRFDAVAVE